MAAPSPQPGQPSDIAQIYASVPLPLGSSDSTRLLRILDCDPLDDDSPILCEMTVASMTESYIALSYMWCEAAASEAITLNGSRILIRKNLWDFLHQRRQDQRSHADRSTHDGADAVAEPQYLWIDALWINQETISERNHQVALMSRIYSSAAYVISWLGAPARLPRLWDYINAYQLHPFSIQPWQNMTTSDYELLSRLFDILYHPYWTRAWILQECILASELRLQEGSQQALATVFSDSIIDILHCDSGRSNYPDALKVLGTREKWRDSSMGAYFYPWHNGMVHSFCSDPRDSIFSAIAIMDPALGIVPDYSKTEDELFVMIADGHIEWDLKRFDSVKNLAAKLCLDFRGG